MRRTNSATPAIGVVHPTWPEPPIRTDAAARGVSGEPSAAAGAGRRPNVSLTLEKLIIINLRKHTVYRARARTVRAT